MEFSDGNLLLDGNVLICVGVLILNYCWELGGEFCDAYVKYLDLIYFLVQ